MSGERIRLIGISLWLQAGFHAAKYGPHDPVAGYDTRRASIARLHQVIKPIHLTNLYDCRLCFLVN